MKTDLPFLVVTIATHFGKVIRIIIHNLFAFLHLLHKICQKKGKILFKKGVRIKKRSFDESI